MIPYYILAIDDENDREFMSALFIQYEKLMYSTIRKITQDSWIVDDIFQSTFEKLIEKISLLRSLDRDHLVNYLIVACRNTTYNVCRHQQKHFIEDIETYGNETADHQNFANVEDYVILKSQLELLKEIWPQLDARSRYLLEAKYILEMGDAEIASSLDIKPSSVRMSLTRARKNALELLKNKKNEPQTKENLI